MNVTSHFSKMRFIRVSVGKGVGDIRVSDEDTTNQCRELHGRVRREGAYADVRQLRRFLRRSIFSRVFLQYQILNKSFMTDGIW